ncbi:hypothetical protein [Streptomyces lavendofoliae]|uniref:Uncharacterized protein n=1 Tax=Streptomyces lavendofoliae TaxID=67314 RepID=A0A918HVR3_9ACTN|nr:hypothetical protein [Streptomyces lavendofoliae]GGU32624.1 hypothetical protein GCM10010274_19530 [Streptomyces lavendofoliae]
MKLRHVRAVAVFGIAIVALTGARGSGGGCSSNSGSGSHSSGSDSGSSTTGGGHDNDGSGSSGGVSVPGGSSSADKAARDIKIDECRMDDSGKNLVARLTVTNSGSLDYTYNITMKFRGDATSGTTTARADVTGVTVKAGASQQAEATTTYTGTGNGSEYKECVVDRATKTAL